MLKRSQCKEKRYFDEGRIPNDVWSVLKAASLLSVGEFRVFEIAYEQWYGERGEEKTIEKYFTSYMFNDIVPVWVRDFCKKIVKLDQDDVLDPAEFGIVRAAATMEQRNRGLEFIMLLILFLIDLRLRRAGAQASTRLIAALTVAFTPWQSFAGSILHPDNFLLATLLLFILAVQDGRVLSSALAAWLMVLAKPNALNGSWNDGRDVRCGRRIQHG